MHDARGVEIRRGDLVVWFGKIGREKPSLHIGEATSSTIFAWTPRVNVEVVRHGDHDEWISTGIFRKIKPDHVVVIDNVPESPYE